MLGLEAPEFVSLPWPTEGLEVSADCSSVRRGAGTASDLVCCVEAVGADTGFAIGFGGS